MKISEAEREEVKRMYFEQGMTRKDIASTKGLSQRYVSAIINNTDMGHGYRTTGRRKPPAGRITFEMIDEVMNSAICIRRNCFRGCQRFVELRLCSDKIEAQNRGISIWFL